MTDVAQTPGRPAAAPDELNRLLDLPAEQAARRLLGCRLERTVDTADGPRLLSGRIVETEAYDQSDAASHSYKGRTPRTDVMFGPAGRLYVYFTYGMHYCCNVVCGPQGQGSAVLIRALQPLEGLDFMTERRGGQTGPAISNGPAKLCQALAIDKGLNGHDLVLNPLRLIMQPPLATEEVIQTTRIGIRLAIDIPWRFYIRDNPYVSKLARTELG